MTRFLNLWSFTGRIGRAKYFVLGMLAFLLKSNIDRIVATYDFHRPWGLLNYWFPFPSPSSPGLPTGHVADLGLTLLLISFPFIWFGVALTVKRLRDIGQPVWLSLLFFAPFFNLLFFAILCVWRPAERQEQRAEEPLGQARGTMSQDALGSAVVAIIVTAFLGAALVTLSTKYTANYGWGLFVALPVCLGFFSVLIYSWHQPRTASECLVVSIAPVMLVAVGLILLAFEGFICIAMAAPLGLGLSALGGLVGCVVQQSRWAAKGRPAIMSMILMIVPLTMGFDPQIERQPPVIVVHSTVEINAPPEVVWQKVVTFSDIPGQREWLFHTGIAYPLRATLQGHGVGAVRRCEFTTGTFVEPIQIWQEPKLLRFGVTQNPAPMEELTPYGHIETAHLNGYFVSREGQFELAPLPGGRTQLTGTTWYTDRVWPGSYWRIWSDYIIHRIHMRVLRHIQGEAEKAAKVNSD